MNRRAFVDALPAIFVAASAPALSAPRSVVLVVSSNAPGIADDLENFMAGALRDRSVAVVDPSSIDLTYHHRARLLAARTAFGGVVDYASMTWVETKYHSERAMLCNVRFALTALPYGEFVVTTSRAIASYRCYDVVSKRIISAGSATVTNRGEDQDAVQQRSGNEALLTLARRAAPQLR